MANGKVFDLHFEIGVNGPPNADFYCLTILGQNGVMFQADGSSPAAALSKVAIDMEQAGMWSFIAKHPVVSAYPLGTAPSVQPTITVDPKAPKQRPSDLHSVAHPTCQQMCLSFEHFGVNKCKNICAQRSGL